MKKNEKMHQPPVDIEQWLDFIIAVAAHRSQNESQRKFGEMLLNIYFVELRDDYKDDPIAKAYLDNILCAVASAIRGFSVVRDMFATNWDTIKEAKERERIRAEQIDNFSPFRKDGYWKSALEIIGLLGFTSILLSAFQNYIGKSPMILVMVIVILIIIILFSMQFLVDHIRNHRMAKLEERYPEELIISWQEKTLRNYRLVLRQFLIVAVKIREEFYPNLTTINQNKIYQQYLIPHIDCGVRSDNKQNKNIDEIEQQINEIIEKHFAFR